MKIEPCPECNSEKVELQSGIDASVMCLSCLARTGKYATVQEAVDAWNVLRRRRKP